MARGEQPGVGPIDLLNEAVIQDVAVAALAPDDAIPEIYDRTCHSCLDLDLPDPGAELTTTERMARKHPPRDFDLAALGTWRWDPYPPQPYVTSRMRSSVRAPGAPCR
jgi:hypothetical protein